MHINLLMFYFVFGLLSFAVIGWPLLALTALYHVIMPILAIAAVLARPARPFAYPWIFHIINDRKDLLAAASLEKSESAKALRNPKTKS